ncbi:17997_t:CDS:2, partial [Dentiscutata erythropus]
DLCEICTLFKANLLATKKDIDEYNKVQVEFNKHKEAEQSLVLVKRPPILTIVSLLL